MSGLRALWADLVEKRLWPVAVLLLAALVAVPLLLSKAAANDSGEPRGLAPAAAAAAAASAGGDAGAGGNVDAEPTVVQLADGSDHAAMRGRAKNPFRPHLPPRRTREGAALVAGAGENAGNSGAEGGSGSGGDSGANGGGGSGGAAPGGASGGRDGATGGGDGSPATPTATIDVRFGRAGTRLAEIADVPRLTPLPSEQQPIVIYLGLRRDRRTALFMISTDVRAQGDGRCVPSRTTCEAIELQAGQVAFLDHTADDGRITQYELDLTAVRVP